jgi:protein SCO1/2
MRRQRGISPAFYVALAVAVILSGALAYKAVRNRNAQQGLQSIRVTGIPASVPTSLANLMALSPVPHSLAPNFTLVDQHGKSMSLKSFRGRTVVLEFMDPHCVDICPIVSQEFVDAYHELGARASNVVFVAVNVNQYYTSVSDMAKFSNEHRLNTIPSWHFLTGSVKDLKSIWRNYGIAVIAPKPTTDIVHTSIVYFIGPNGRKRYIGVPMDDHTAKGTSYLPANQLISWGHGIALVAESLSS